MNFLITIIQNALTATHSMNNDKLLLMMETKTFYFKRHLINIKISILLQILQIFTSISLQRFIADTKDSSLVR